MSIVSSYQCACVRVRVFFLFVRCFIYYYYYYYYYYFIIIIYYYFILFFFFFFKFQ